LTEPKKHVEELIKAVENLRFDRFLKAKEEGLNASILFLIMREDAECFSPNYRIDPDFSNALKDAYHKGVKIIAYSFKNNYKKESLEIMPFKRVKIEF